MIGNEFPGNIKRAGVRVPANTPAKYDFRPRRRKDLNSPQQMAGWDKEAVDIMRFDLSFRKVLVQLIHG